MSMSCRPLLNLTVVVLLAFLAACGDGMDESAWPDPLR